MKADRKRLKAEKFDVLNQMKQLYATLEDKEKELRDFIRTYEKVRPVFLSFLLSSYTPRVRKSVTVKFNPEFVSTEFKGFRDPKADYPNHRSKHYFRPSSSTLVHQFRNEEHEAKFEHPAHLER